jgi:putative transposase
MGCWDGKMKDRKYCRRLRYPRLASHHLISRVVQKRRLMDGEAMEAMRQIMRSQAAFAGMEVLTYCFLSNHFHIFVRLDPKETEHLDDGGLVERFRALYGSKKCASLGLDADDLEVILKNNRASAEGIRRRLKARMGDVSVFMREFKTRFTFWYNEKHGTVGTFWAERFRSVVVEADTEAQKMVAAYIDLNPVRAGLVEDAAEYRFSGFGEACAGGSAARRGIARIQGKAVWATTWHERYRARLGSRMGRRMRPSRSKQKPAGATRSEDESGANATEGSGLLSKIRAFSEGWVVGSVAWVESFCAANGWLGYQRGTKAQAVSADGGTSMTNVASVVKRPGSFHLKGR